MTAFGQTIRPDFAARPAFGKSAQHLPDCPKPTKSRGLARYQRAARNAAELLPEIPLPGESHHCLMTGTYDLCQAIIEVVKRLPTLTALRIATLSYSKRNAVELLALLEARPGIRLTVLASTFFRNHNKEMHAWFEDELKAYPTARLAAGRTHCKVVCFELGQGDGLVFEGSANLRTNGAREQLTAFRSRSVHDWHSKWIEEMVKHAETNPEEEAPKKKAGEKSQKSEVRGQKKEV
jgi:hypothetical protein